MADKAQAATTRGPASPGPMPAAEPDILAWYADYVRRFESCGRGEKDVSALLDFYGVPLVLVTGDGPRVLSAKDEVTDVFRQSAEALVASGYDRSEPRHIAARTINKSTHLVEAAFDRVRGDGTSVGEVSATYIVTGGPGNRRISVMVLG